MNKYQQVVCVQTWYAMEVLMDGVYFIPIVLIIIAGFSIVTVVTYHNKLLKAKKNAEDTWHTIDIQLQRRHTLIPNLAEVSKGYVMFEKDIIEKIKLDCAAAVAADPNNLDQRSEVETVLDTDLQSLASALESYPTIKANGNYIKLMDELTEIQTLLANNKKIYNANAADYNTLIAVFPSNIVANFYYFKEIKSFQIQQKAANTP